MDSRNIERNYEPNSLDPRRCQAHMQNIGSQMYQTNNFQNISSQNYQTKNLISQNNFQRLSNFGPREHNSYFGSIDYQSTSSVGQNDHQILEDR